MKANQVLAFFQQFQTLPFLKPHPGSVAQRHMREREKIKKTKLITIRSKYPIWDLIAMWGERGENATATVAEFSYPAY